MEYHTASGDTGRQWGRDPGSNTQGKRQIRCLDKLNMHAGGLGEAKESKRRTRAHEMTQEERGWEQREREVNYYIECRLCFHYHGNLISFTLQSTVSGLHYLPTIQMKNLD